MEPTSSADEAKILNEVLRKRLKRVNEQMLLLAKEREAILILLSGSSPAQERIAGISSDSTSAEQLVGTAPAGGRGGLVDKIVEFLDINRKAARANQIMDYLVKSGYTFADSKNPKTHLFAILSQEAKKEKRIVRVRRGLYGLKKSEG